MLLKLECQQPQYCADEIQSSRISMLHLLGASILLQDLEEMKLRNISPPQQTWKKDRAEQRREEVIEKKQSSFWNVTQVWTRDLATGRAGFAFHYPGSAWQSIRTGSSAIVLQITLLKVIEVSGILLTWTFLGEHHGSLHTSIILQVRCPKVNLNLKKAGEKLASKDLKRKADPKSTW